MRATAISTLSKTLKKNYDESQKAHIEYVLKRLNYKFGYYEKWKDPKSMLTKDLVVLKGLRIDINDLDISNEVWLSVSTTRVLAR